MQLECTSVGGNPLAQVAWERNGDLVDFNFTTRNNKAVNALTFVAKPADNGAVFVCKAWNVVNADTPLRANRSLIVHCKSLTLPYFAMYCAHSCITHTQFLGVKSGEKSHVPIHNTQQIWTTDRGCIKLSILSSYYPSSPISITHGSIQHWHLINDELKRKRKLKRKKKKKKKSFARHSPRCSFLSVSLYGIMRKKKKNNVC